MTLRDALSRERACWCTHSACLRVSSTPTSEGQTEDCSRAQPNKRLMETLHLYQIKFYPRLTRQEETRNYYAPAPLSLSTCT